MGKEYFYCRSESALAGPGNIEWAGSVTELVTMPNSISFRSAFGAQTSKQISRVPGDKVTSWLSQRRAGFDSPFVDLTSAAYSFFFLFYSYTVFL